MEVLVLVCIALVTFFVITALNASEKRTDLIVRIRALPSFSPAEQLATPNVAIALDPSSNKVALALRRGEDVLCVALPYSAITGVDILRSEGGTTKTKKTGFATFTTNSNITNLSLAVTTTDKRIPYLIVPLFEAVGDSTFDDSARDKAFRVANEWRAKLLAIVRMSAPPEPVQASGLAPRSVASEIESLHQLVKAGALSQAEFEQAKGKLLGGG
jgi:hypothetical protein